MDYKNDDIGYVHLRIQQRNKRQTITTVEGIPNKYDLKRIAKVCKKQFACNACIIDDTTYGKVIQLQGDQRENIKTFLSSVGIVPETHIKVHGAWYTIIQQNLKSYLIIVSLT